ncbi:MAG: hypothetical protein OSA40_03865 [Phycisphaerales bacterium]|nr:hypothetical protein [Phycisphaerales bacterium]
MAAKNHFRTLSADRRRHERIALELTTLPTAAGREHRVQAYVDRWLAARSRSLVWRRDGDGNLLINSKKRPAGRTAPLLITAHLDHPAFVVRHLVDDRTIEAEFRGGVHDPYFENAKLEFHDADDRIVRGRIESLAPADGERLFKVATIRLSRRLPSLAVGDVGRWAFPAAAITGRGSKRLLKTNACDDLAAAAAALCAFDRIRKRRGMEHVGLLFTVAEEVGFVGAIGAATNGLVKKNARLVCLENSRSFPESPIGGGPIVRVGDRMTVFSPGLTNEISTLMMAHAAANPKFKWQRKLMAGGACEATAFSAFGFQSTCLCLPLGNYHNMQAIDEVQAGRRPAKVGREFISVEDLHGLIEMLEVVAGGLDASTAGGPLPQRLRALRRRNKIVLDG